MKTIYVAFDGKQFESKTECQKYEKSFNNDYQVDYIIKLKIPVTVTASSFVEAAIRADQQVSEKGFENFPYSIIGGYAENIELPETDTVIHYTEEEAKNGYVCDDGDELECL